MDEELLLSGNFQQYPECKQIFSVQLGRKNLICQERQDPSITYRKFSQGLTSILLKDIVSAKLFKSKISDDCAAYFQVISYPLAHGGKGKKAPKRGRIMLTFRVNDSEDSEENSLIAETWARTIEWLIYNPDISNERLQDVDNFPKKKRVLVLINPKSGNGKSLEKFRKFAEPLFKDAGIYFQELITKYASHGQEIAYNLSIIDWDGLAICSGDGLAYEVIQGLMQRGDWEKAIKMPIGMIPTGSGNALCASVLHAANDVCDILSAAFHVARGNPHPIDLCSIQNHDHRLFAFLSLTWGIISDIDIESERLRLLGNARFTVGAVHRILALRTYKGRLSYIPCEGEASLEMENPCDYSPVSSLSSHATATEKRQQTQNAENDASCVEVKDTTSHAKQTAKLRHFSMSSANITKSKSSKYASINDGHVKVTSSFEENDDEDEALNENATGGVNHSATSQSAPRTQRAFSTNAVGMNKLPKRDSSTDVRHPIRPVNGPVDIMLPPIAESLPEGSWVMHEGDFVTVIVMLVSHLGSTLFTCPDLTLGDGFMELLFVKKGISRKSLIDMLIKMETGEHIKNKDLYIRRIKAFRLEPSADDKEGYIAVDGEPVNYETTQGQIHKGLARVFLC
eukprot:gene8857-9806_t